VLQDVLARQEYDANCVTTQAESVVYCNVTEGSIAPYARFFTNQWDGDRLSKYKPMIGIWVDESTGEITGEEGWKPLFQNHLENIQREITPGATGVSFDDILDEIGRDNVIILSNERSKE